MVIGDPLAKPLRTRDDRNADGKLTVDDLYTWFESPFDLNRSGAADRVDRTQLEEAMRGGEGAGLQGTQRN